MKPALPPALAATLAADGTISVADYMELALQHPDFGYYRHGDPLGRAGDFITAPEISQLFGEMIGVWCAEVWRQLGQPARFTLLELGPGHGTLMQDALRATAKINGFHTGLSLCLLESSATLRAKQQEKLATFTPRFLDRLEDLDAHQPLIVIANEFFDALPVRQFEKTFQGWQERLVTRETNDLLFTLAPPDPTLDTLIPTSLRKGAVGTVYELSLPSVAVMQKLATLLAQKTGAGLIVDYGYATPPRLGTLQAVSGHQSVPFLTRPGQVDLTAHVDFTLLKRMAEKEKLNVFGPIGQGSFLEKCGIHLRAAQLKRHATPEQTALLDSSLHRLTDSGDMGTLFKALMIASPSLETSLGF